MGAYLDLPAHGCRGSALPPDADVPLLVVEAYTRPEAQIVCRHDKASHPQKAPDAGAGCSLRAAGQPVQGSRSELLRAIGTTRLIILTFHGIGEPPADVGDDERLVWVPAEKFERVLSLV